jgi:bifunctional oligoribonuclease and PAP phosphatase NrnA
MGITPQTNILLEDLAHKLIEHDYIQICGHASPDGDCIGSALAMKLALEACGKKVDCLVALKEPLPKKYDFLKGFSDMAYSGHVKKTADAFLMIDTPNDKRMGYAAAKMKDATPNTFTLDHHAEPKRATQFTFTDTSAASTSVLVWELLDFLPVEKTSDIAVCCFTGLATDTGNFQYQNTDERAFKRACEMVKAGANPSVVSENVYMRNSLASYKLQSKTIENMQLFDDGQGAISFVTRADIEETGAVKGDFDAMINVLRSLDGTKVVAVAREEKTFVKVSLRSLGEIDVRKIAEKFGGGGHQGASGIVIEKPLKEVVVLIKEAMHESLLEQAG